MQQAGRSGDPNFPRGLRIQPSSLLRSAKPSGHQSTPAPEQQDESWEQDTAEDIDDYGIAGRIWEAAYLLARYLKPANQLSGELVFHPPCSLFDRQDDKPLTIVELGSGAGYGSLHLARQLYQHAEASSSTKPQVRLVLTDLANVVPLMQRNVARAGYQQRTDTIDVRVRSLAWGNQQDAEACLAELRPEQSSSASQAAANPLTHILCSDLVYFPELLPPLLRTIISLSEPGPLIQDSEASVKLRPELIISYKIRSLTKEQPFWSALGSWFDFQAVDYRSIPKPSADSNTQNGTDDLEETWHRFGSQGEDYGACSDADQELFVFVGHRRRDTVGCLAPESDQDLMQGKRLRKRQTLEGVLEFVLEAPVSGQDYFEWLLLSNMGAGLG